MAGDRKQYQRALVRWDALRAERRFSYPSEIGVTAVMYSHYSIEDADDEAAEEELKYFAWEAGYLADIGEDNGRRSEVISATVICRACFSTTARGLTGVMLAIWLHI